MHNAQSTFSEKQDQLEDRLDQKRSIGHLQPNRWVMAPLHRFVLVKQRYRRWLLHQMGVECGRNCTIGDYADLQLGLVRGQWGRISIANHVTLSQGVILHSYGGSISIAEHVFLGPNTTIYGHGGVKIGRNTLIAMNTAILSSNHTIPSRKGCIREQPDILQPTVIGEDVWLGAGVTVLGGVTIGDGCVVGAGAVVSQNLPAYSIAVGVPAKVIRTR